MPEKGTGKSRQRDYGYVLFHEQVQLGMSMEAFREIEERPAAPTSPDRYQRRQPRRGTLLSGSSTNLTASQGQDIFCVLQYKQWCRISYDPQFDCPGV